MLRAVALAKRCKAESGRITPKVGAVIARHGVSLGEAYRGELGPGEHAEYTLLHKKLRDRTLAGTTLYTTLEPCTSRNSPKRACVDRIIERRIRKVVIGTLDPNDQIRGRGELRLREAGVEIGRFDPDLMARLEELNREFMRLHPISSRRSRSGVVTTDPVAPNQVGPNGHRIGYTKNGDKVEWVPDDERPGREWPLVLRRNDRAILKAYNEYWDKVWYNRHQVWVQKIRSSKQRLNPSARRIFARTERAARKIELKYGGHKKLEWDDFEWGLLSGRMSALAWVMGAQWDESLDT